MTRADLKKQLVKEKTTKTLLVYNGGALSCRARQIDSYYFITATRQAREKMLNWLLPKYHLGTVYMELGGGGPQIGEISCGGSTHLSCKRDYVTMRDYMDRRVTPPKEVTSRTWGPPPPFKQALKPVFIKLPITIRFSLC